MWYHLGASQTARKIIQCKRALAQGVVWRDSGPRSKGSRRSALLRPTGHWSTQLVGLSGYPLCGFPCVNTAQWGLVFLVTFAWQQSGTFCRNRFSAWRSGWRLFEVLDRLWLTDTDIFFCYQHEEQPLGEVGYQVKIILVLIYVSREHWEPRERNLFQLLVIQIYISHFWKSRRLKYNRVDKSLWETQ